MPRHFRSNRRLHFAQAIQRGVVQVAAIDERAQALEPLFTCGDVTRHGTRFQPRIALPVAAFALEILVHAGEGKRHAPRIAEWPQAQVHAVAEAIHGGLVQQLGQALAQSCEIVFGRQWAWTIGLAAFGIGIDEVDVGRKIQFAATQFAQAEHHQPLRHAFGIAHHAMSPREFHLQGLQAKLQAVLGELRTAGQGGLHAVQAQHVTPDQARGSGRAVTAQLLWPNGHVLCRQHRQRHRLRAGVAGQRTQQVGLATQGFQCEITGRDDLCHARGHVGIGQQLRRLRRTGAQLRQAACDQCVDGVFVQRRGGSHESDCVTAFRSTTPSFPTRR